MNSDTFDSSLGMTEFFETADISDLVMKGTDDNMRYGKTNSAIGGM